MRTVEFIDRVGENQHIKARVEPHKYIAILVPEMKKNDC